MIDININTTIDELLELWVKYSFEMYKGGEKVVENLETRQNINKMLAKKGIENLVIFNMGDKSYTLRFLHRGTKKVQKVPIKE